MGVAEGDGRKEEEEDEIERVEVDGLRVEVGDCVREDESEADEEGNKEEEIEGVAEGDEEKAEVKAMDVGREEREGDSGIGADEDVEGSSDEEGTGIRTLQVDPVNCAGQEQVKLSPFGIQVP